MTEQSQTGTLLRQNHVVLKKWFAMYILNARDQSFQIMMNKIMRVKLRKLKIVVLVHKVPQEVKASASPARRDSRAKLRIIPLGGLDAIGKNMTAFECGNDMVLDDAGLMFPDDNHPGIDLILPDYSYVLENAEKLRGIIITHGHEDHTGALPYLLKDLDRKVPIYATKLTLGLIEEN